MTTSVRPAVSVVIPAYGAANTIVRAVESALRQDDCTANVIVVIDDNCMRTKELVRKFSESRVYIVCNEKPLGAPSARNCGLGLAKTEYVHFLDADDYLLGDVVGKLIQKMKMCEANIGFAPSIQWSPRRGYHAHVVPDYKDHAHILWLWLGLKRNVTTCSMVWRRDYLLSIGGWKEGLRRSQDTELTLRAVLLGAKFAVSAEGCGVWCHTESDSITARSDNLDAPLEVVEGFLAMESSVMPNEVRNLACAHYLYYLAHKAFAAGVDSVGRQALARSRSLGFHGHLGNMPHVLLSRLCGLERKQQLVRLLKRNRPTWFGRK